MVGVRLKYNNVKRITEENGCELLSTEYVNNCTKMKFRCKCGNEFESSWLKFYNSNKRQCNYCSFGRSANKLTYEEARDKAERLGYILLDDSYINGKTPSKLQCKCGNVFYYNLIKLQLIKGCENCNPKFFKWDINKINEWIANNTDLQLVSKQYVNSKTNLEFICDCGDTFACTWRQIYYRGKRCCNKCTLEKQKQAFKFKYEEVKDWIENNINTVLVSKEYINCDLPLIIKCPHCNIEYTTSFWKLKNNRFVGCRDCILKQMGNYITQIQTYSYDYIKNYIEENSTAKLISKEYISNKQTLNLMCECGNLFYTSFEMIKNGNYICLCKNCKKSYSIVSIGEERIKIILNKFKVNFIREFEFEDCKFIKRLPFDFYIKSNNQTILIEYNGEQHYKAIEYLGGLDKFKLQQKRDRIKAEYCKKNDYELIIIPYWDYHNIEKILVEKLQLNIEL